MRILDLERALVALKERVNMYSLTIKGIRPAYDSIVFETSSNIKYKYWYMTNEITQLQDWRVRHA